MIAQKGKVIGSRQFLTLLVGKGIPTFCAFINTDLTGSYGLKVMVTKEL
jgi:hypothetical protein